MAAVSTTESPEQKFKAPPAVTLATGLDKTDRTALIEVELQLPEAGMVYVIWVLP